MQSTFSATRTPLPRTRTPVLRHAHAGIVSCLVFAVGLDAVARFEAAQPEGQPDQTARPTPDQAAQAGAGAATTAAAGSPVAAAGAASPAAAAGAGGGGVRRRAEAPPPPSLGGELLQVWQALELHRPVLVLAHDTRRDTQVGGWVGGWVVRRVCCGARAAWWAARCVRWRARSGLAIASASG